MSGLKALTCEYYKHRQSRMTNYLLQRDAFFRRSGVSVTQRIRLHDRNGAHEPSMFRNTHKLDKRLARVFPRGKAFRKALRNELFIVSKID